MGLPVRSVGRVTVTSVGSDAVVCFSYSMNGFLSDGHNLLSPSGCSCRSLVKAAFNVSGGRHVRAFSDNDDRTVALVTISLSGTKGPGG